jgi:hypothetical protein
VHGLSPCVARFGNYYGVFGSLTTDLGLMVEKTIIVGESNGLLSVAEEEKGVG